MFIKIPFIKRKLRGLSLKIFNMVENNGNCNFDKNGEDAFIENLLMSFEKVGGEESSV